MGNRHHSFWNDETKEKARRLYIEENKSATDTGAIMGVSRNAVIGIINRMGLRKEKGEAMVKAPRVRKKYARVRTPAGYVENHLKEALPILVQGEDIPPLLASLHDITHWVCPYPYGTPATQFCGRPKTRGAFCSKHAQICYVEPLYRLRG